MRLMAIDPGAFESAYVVINDRYRPLWFGKIANEDVRFEVSVFRGPIYIESIASYGMPVGAEVFETCVWVGRFLESALRPNGRLPERVPRQPVKVHHCHSSKAKDSNVIQALADRFAPGQPNYGKGTKAAPGWFHGFKADIWQAYALAVYAADTREQMSA